MRRNQLALKASNVLLSAGVVAIFLYLLMLAMAQEQVLSSLSRTTDFKNYSFSLGESRKGDEGEKAVAEINDKRDALRRDLEKLEADAAEARMEYERLIVRINPVLVALDASKGCDIPHKAALPTTGMTPREAEMHVKDADLAALTKCLAADTKLDPALRADYRKDLLEADKISEKSIRLETARKVKAQQLKATDASSWRERQELKRLDPIRAHFRVLDALAPPAWFPLNFTNHPPFITHVLLSFFAGTFGALLITMVFVVYPSKLRERVSAKLYYKRVFLGGLVAVTVFIVLTGGASILGTGEASQVGTNVMSFTAIGLLAGMFSDTVADWLSARAKTMFSSDDDDDGKKDGRNDPGDPGRARPA
jgi:hypothetical protein